MKVQGQPHDDAMLPMRIEASPVDEPHAFSLSSSSTAFVPSQLLGGFSKFFACDDFDFIKERKADFELMWRNREVGAESD